MLKFYNSATNQVSVVDDEELENAVDEFISNDQTGNVAVGNGIVLQHPVVIKHPYTTGQTLMPADLKLCIFTDAQRKSCLFMDPPMLDMETVVSVSNDYAFSLAWDDESFVSHMREQFGRVLYGWIFGETFFSPIPHLAVFSNPMTTEKRYVVFNWPQEGPIAGTTRAEMYKDPPVPGRLKSVGRLSWDVKHGKWSNVPQKSILDRKAIALRKRLDEWIRNGTIDFDYNGIRIEYPARIGFNKAVNKWQLQAGDFWLQEGNKLFLTPPPNAEEGTTSQMTVYHMKYKGVPMSMSKVIAEWASKQSDISKHDAFAFVLGEIMILRMPLEYDRYDRKTPIQAINIRENKIVDLYPEEDEEEKVVLQLVRPKKPERTTLLPSPNQKDTPKDNWRPNKVPPAEPQQKPVIVKLSRRRAPQQEPPQPALPPPPPPFKKKDPPIPEEERAPLRKRDLEKYDERSASPPPPPPAPVVPAPSLPEPKIPNSETPLRKRNLKLYDRKKRPTFKSPYVEDFSSVRIENAKAQVNLLTIAQAQAKTRNSFSKWIKSGNGEFVDDLGRTFSYPGKIGKFSRSSTEFHFYATSADNELEMIYTQKVPVLVLGKYDSGENIIYRWENGNEFTRLESQAIYKWKQGTKYMHQIMYADLNQEGVTYILDYATNTATVYVPGADPIKITFQLDAQVVRLKRGKYTQCSICAEPAQWMCLCSKAYYCTEACAAKDDEAHAKC